MGAYFLVVNPAKRQFLDPSRFGEAIKFREALNGDLCCLALKELIADAYGGDWVGDPVILAGDDTGGPNPPGVVTVTADAPERNLNGMAREEFTDISYRSIASLCSRRADVVQSVIERANKDSCFFIDLVNVTLQYKVPQLEHAIRERFGKDWRREYDNSLRKYPDHVPLPPIESNFNSS